MDIKILHRVFFLGIGGIGMSAIAKYFLSRGIEVFGYDRTESITTKQLTEAGANICFTDDISLIPDNLDLVVFTPAIPKTHKQFNFFLENNYILKKRAEILGVLTHGFTTIALAGTHGKTTTAAIITHVFMQAGKNFKAFLGGISNNYNSNFIHCGDDTETTTVIVEADEYDRSFLQLYPDIAVVTAMDPDHLDIYGNYENMLKSYNDFMSQIKTEGHLIIQRKFEKHLTCKPSHIYNYAIDEDAVYHIANLKIVKGAYRFDIICKGEKLINDVQLNLGGLHNIENALAAVAVCHLSGIDVSLIKKALQGFSGVYRRFDTRLKGNKLIFIDDYAHHPQELFMFIKSVRNLYPQKKITGIFQPHLYSRTKDFARGFAEALSLLDDVILLDIYPAREEPIEGVSSRIIFDKISIEHKMLCSKEHLIEEIVKRKSDIFLTMGAGDIENLVSPIEKTLKNIEQFL